MSSSNRMKAIAYDKDRRAKSGATSSQFGKVGRNIDAESEKPKLSKEAFVDRPKYQQDEQESTSKDVRADLEKIERDGEKETDKTEFKSEVNPKTVRKAPVSTFNDTIVKYETGGAFLKAWTVVDHISIPPVIQPKKSSFVPNYIVASIIIEAMERCLDGNEEMKWINPNYFSLPVRVYYAVIWHLQVLKAKEAARKITKSESAWYRSFKRSFPLESLPIAGPLVPYLSNIVSVKPNDDKYDYVHPELVTNGGLTIAKGVPTVRPTFWLQPNVALLAQLLRQFARATNDQLSGQTNGADNFFDDQGSFVPHRTGMRFMFAGIDFLHPLNPDLSLVMSNPAMDKPMPEIKSRMLDILPYWNRSKVRDIPGVPEDETFDTMASAMRMDEDFEWFEDCIMMAAIQCKFFSDSTNLSQIPSTGGSEVLVTCEITGKNENYKGSPTWYPENWKNLKSTFQTTRADTGPEQFLNQEYALTTGTLSWTSNGHNVGGVNANHRTGPYWRNKEFEFRLENPVPVARRIATMIQSQFYHRKGDAS